MASSQLLRVIVVLHKRCTTVPLLQHLGAAPRQRNSAYAQVIIQTPAHACTLCPLTASPSAKVL
jgi:hypothetical protein